MQKLNGVLSILNWYISSLIPLLRKTRICASKWIKSTDFQSKYAHKKKKKKPEHTGTMQCGPDSPFILIWGWALTVWSTLTGLDWESKRGLLLSFCNQALASYVVTQSICFIVRVGGEVNASKRQNLPPSTTAVLPSSDPVPADRAIPSLDTECLTVVVNVLGEQLKCILGGSREWPALLQGSSDSPAEFGAQWAKIQVQVIAGWMGDRQPGQMRIRRTLWSEDQEVFIALEQWLVMTGHSSLESFSPFSVKMLILKNVQLFISSLSCNHLKNQRV